MLADRAETLGLEFAQPSPGAGEKLRDRLPDIATVSNPLDYTTPIWGNPERVPPVFQALLEDGYDSAVLVQDYPAPGLDESKSYYLTDAQSFVAETQKLGIPATVCSTLPENMDRETRDMLVGAGVTPGQGIHETLDAVHAATRYGEDRARILSTASMALIACQSTSASPRTIDEWEGKQLLKSTGISTPDGGIVSADTAVDAARELGFPVALKMVHANLAHKTDAGAVAIGIRSDKDLVVAIDRMKSDVAVRNPACLSDTFLVERMVDRPIAELMVSTQRDPDFGLAMTVASGGVLIDLFDDAQTILLPASRSELELALGRLRSAPLLGGHRGAAVADVDVLVDTLMALGALAAERIDDIVEIEINPLFVLPDSVVAVDALVSVA